MFELFIMNSLLLSEKTDSFFDVSSTHRTVDDPIPTLSTGTVTAKKHILPVTIHT